MEYCKIRKTNLAQFEPVMDELVTAKWQQDPMVNGIGAVLDGEAVGVLFYRYDGESARIIHLAVPDIHRGKGIATALVNELCRACDREVIPIYVGFFSDGAPEEDERILFFDSLWCFSGELEPEKVWQITREELENSEVAGYVEKARKEKDIRHFRELLKAEKGKLFQTMGQTESVVGNAAERVEELCMVAGDPGAPDAAVFVCQGDTEGEYILSYVWNKEGGTVKLINTLSRVAEAALSMEPPLRHLRITTVNRESERLMQRMFPQRELLGQYYTAAWDIGDLPLAFA